MDVEVIYPYDPQEDDELRLCVGDIVSNVEYLEKGWCKGVLNNISGAFPDNFVKEISPSNKSIKPNVLDVSNGNSSNGSPNLGMSNSRAVRRMCRAGFSYTPQHEDELALKEGDLLMVLQEVEEGWWKGILNGVVGMFPSNFVEEVDDQLMTTLDSANSVSSSQSTHTADLPRLFGRTSNERTSIRSADSAFKSVSKSQDNSTAVEKLLDKSYESRDSKSRLSQSPRSGIRVVAPDVGGEMVNSMKTAKIPVERNSLGGPRGLTAPSGDSPNISSPPELPPKPARELAKALYDYSAEQEDELELREGDIVHVVCKDLDDKGWWRGELNGRVGVFPDNFVQVVSSIGVLEKSHQRPPRPKKAPKTPCDITTNGHSETLSAAKDNGQTGISPPPLPGKKMTPLPPTVQKKPQVHSSETPKPLSLETPKPHSTDTPKSLSTETPNLLPTETPKPHSTETPKSLSAETSKPQIHSSETPKPIPVETPKLLTSETPKPPPTETRTPLPTETLKPIQSETPNPLPTETPKPIHSETPKPPLTACEATSADSCDVTESSLSIERENTLPRLVRARGPVNRRPPSNLLKQKSPNSSLNGQSNSSRSENEPSLTNGSTVPSSRARPHNSPSPKPHIEEAPKSPKGLQKGDRKPPWLKELRQNQKHLSGLFNQANYQEGHSTKPPKPSGTETRASERGGSDEIKTTSAPPLSINTETGPLDLESMSGSLPSSQHDQTSSGHSCDIEKRLEQIEKEFTAKICGLRQKLEDQNSLHLRQIQLLTTDLDEERKQRACLQIEVDRLCKLVKAGFPQV